MEFNDAAKPEKLVQFTDLLQPWLQQSVTPFLESLIGLGRVDEAMELGTAMTTKYSELPEELVSSASAKKPKTKAYVDTTAPFDLADLWDRTVVSTADPVINRMVRDLAEIADGIERGQGEKFLKGFDEIVAAAPAVDVTTLQDFVAVLKGETAEKPAAKPGTASKIAP